MNCLYKLDSFTVDNNFIKKQLQYCVILNIFYDASSSTLVKILVFVKINDINMLLFLFFNTQNIMYLCNTFHLFVLKIQ